MSVIKKQKIRLETLYIRIVTRTNHTNPRTSLLKLKLTNYLQKTLSKKYLLHEIIHTFTCSMRIV